MRWLIKTQVISHNSGGWEAPDQDTSRFGVQGAPLPWTQTAVHPLCPHTAEGEGALLELFSGLDR